jgi:hypothetical protein
MSDTPAVLDVSVHPETNEHTNNGTHAVHIISPGGGIAKLQPGESFIPAKDGQPAVILRNRPA